jgi:hypothetical protein
MRNFFLYTVVESLPTVVMLKFFGGALGIVFPIQRHKTLNKQTDIQTNKQTNKPINKQTDKQTDKQTNKQTNQLTN